MWYVIAILFNCSLALADPRCASTPVEMNELTRFSDIQKLFNTNGFMGMVNETKGSYFTIVRSDSEFRMTFYTSGLFDIYPVKREGPVKFCDDGKTLTLVGIGRTEKLDLTAEALIVGNGGPRMRFHLDDMPQKLRKLHGLMNQGLAGSP